MPIDLLKAARYPLLETVLACKGLPLQGTYSVQDVAHLFDVSTRTIQTRMKRGDLASRDLPGRAKFLAFDLEQFLQNSSTRASVAA
jgi:hypothetical protein